MLRFLREEFDWDYDGVIWDGQTLEELLEDFAEIVDLDEAEKAIFGENPIREKTPELGKTSEIPITDGGVCTNKECKDGHYRAEASKMCANCVNPPEPEIVLPPSEPEPERKPAEPSNEFVVQAGKNSKGDVFSLMGILASDIVPEKLEWLWRDKIPAGKITLFAGQPDCGKSVAMLDFIARITTGKDFPDGTKNERGAQRVLLAATEDDLNTTLIPRLIAAEADMKKVVILKRVVVENGAKQKTKKRMLQLTEDAKLLKLMLKNNPDIAVVALDPISSYFGDCDPNKDKEVRPVMEAIADACEASRTAFVGIIHNNKRGDTDAIGKILGASSIVGVSRAVWGFCKDKEKPGEFFMSLVKGNLARKRSGMKYQIIDATVVINGENEILPRTDWLGESEESADEVMKKNRDADGTGKGDKKIDTIKLLLQKVLDEATGNAVLLREFYTLCEKEGLGETEKIKKTVQRAIKDIGAVCDKPPGSRGPWWVYMDIDAKPWVSEPTIVDQEVM